MLFHYHYYHYYYYHSIIIIIVIIVVVVVIVMVIIIIIIIIIVIIITIIIVRIILPAPAIQPYPLTTTTMFCLLAVCFASLPLGGFTFHFGDNSMAQEEVWGFDLDRPSSRFGVSHLGTMWCRHKWPIFSKVCISDTPLRQFAKFRCLKM